MKPLAKNSIMNVLFFPVSLFLVMSLFTIGGVVQTMVGNVGTVLIFVGLIVWIFLGVRDACNLYYDDEFVYLDGLIYNSKVPLSSVTRIARDLSGMKASGVTAWRYRLEFAPSAKVAAQTIYEVDGGSRVAAFAIIVRQVNPSVVVEL